jgi:hypothetical protein
MTQLAAHKLRPRTHLELFWVPHRGRQTGLGSRVILGPQDKAVRYPGPREGRRCSAALCRGVNWPLLRYHLESGFGQVHFGVNFRQHMSGFGQSHVESTSLTRPFQLCFWIPSWLSFKAVCRSLGWLSEVYRSSG